MINSIEIKKKVSDNWTSTGEKFNYTYDDLGNITAVTDVSNSLISSYVYNNLNELIRENNVQTGKTVAYTYNAGGNMTEKKIYSYTTDADLTNATLESTITYNYGDANWPDKLTSITCGEDEHAIIYDAIGNPLEYRNGWSFSWARGHRLDKMENSGYNVNIAFKYNEKGVRTQKTVNGVQTNFITSGIKLLAQKTGENTLIWQVDGNGNTVGFNYNGVPYFYMKNLQGDIVGITDTSGDIVAKYTYDSWGKLISIKDASDVDRTTETGFIGYINPLRYRGYYYDSETGLYYLNARYYDPEVGRFISADETLDGGYNLFEYCGNNPVSFADCSGHDLEEAAIARVLECAGELATRSFGKAPGGQWEYSSLVYNLEGTWHYTPPRTDHNATEVHEFEDMGSLTLSFAKGHIKTVIGVHTHEVVAQKTRDGSVIWLYDPGFSTPKSVGGVEKSNDITSNRRAFDVFQKRGVRYYAAVVLADGNVLLHDVGENRIYKIGNVAPDPNIRYCKAPSVKGKSTTDDPCIVM